MKLNDIQSQLMSQIGNFTTKFTTTVNVTSITVSGTTATATTQSAHGLKSGQNVFISGAVTPIQVSSLTWANGVATGTTSAAHDLTEKWQGCMGIPAAAVSGADQSAYNIPFSKGWTAPDRNTFTYPVGGSPTTPATGTILLNDGANRGINGVQGVIVTGTNTFTFSIPANIYSPVQGTIICHTGWNIGKAANIERFLEVYSKQLTTVPWLCITMGSSSASADRELQNDAVAMYNAGTLYRQKIVDRCSIYVVVPCSQEIAGADARDLIEDVKQGIFSSILGVQFSSYLQLPQQYGLVFTTGDYVDYDHSKVIYEFKFEQLSQLGQQDIANNGQPNVAFRDLVLQFQNAGNQTIMNTNVDLDDDAGIP